MAAADAQEDDFWIKALCAGARPRSLREAKTFAWFCRRLPACTNSFSTLVNIYLSPVVCFLALTASANSIRVRGLVICHLVQPLSGIIDKAAALPIGKRDFLGPVNWL